MLEAVDGHSLTGREEPSHAGCIRTEDPVEVDLLCPSHMSKGVVEAFE